jgi:membrane protease YdiL (CAAX protease family)
VTARSLFLSPDGRPRALWRIVIFLAVAAILAAATIPIAGSVASLIGAELAGVYAGLCAALLLAHLCVLRWVDRRGWEIVGLGGTAARAGLLLRAAVLGAAAIAIPVMGLWALGWLRLESAPPGSSLAQAARALLVLVPAALFEELLLRGYVFAALRDGVGLVGALLLTSIVFGVLHRANPHTTAVAIAMVTLAGVLLGMVLVSTRSLYAAWVAHLAWNFVLAGIFHVAVSGLGFVTPDYRLVDAGPDWATGGPWGPEGGIAAGLGMSAALAYLIARPRRRGES